MLRDITVGQYLPGDSIIHHLDPRIKIIVTTLLMIAIFLINNWLGLAGLAMLLGTVYWLSHLPGIMLLRGLRPLALIMIIALPLQILLTPGDVLYYLGPFTITRQGILQAGLLTYRLGALIIVTSFLTLTTSPVALTDGLESLMKPLERFRVPAHELAMMMTIALRFIPIFAEEAEKIVKAQKARGADFDSGRLLKRMRNLVAILVPLLISAFRRADELALAMEARCYQGGKNRTRLRQWRIGKSDYVTLAVGLVVLICSFYV
ncbi:MAG: energy-coupling factor transporter transmembrane component T family protein [Bacillota bacterium]